MLPIVWLIVAVVAAVLLTMWVTFTVTRLDRLHARVDAAQAALDAQLVRRAAALQRVADSPGSHLTPEARVGFDSVAQRAIDAPAAGEGRKVLENAVGRAVAELAEQPLPLDPDALGELREAAARVLIARRFYNDAVRDTRALRTRRMPTMLHLAGHRASPEFFDIDDTLPTAVVPDARGATLVPPRSAVPTESPVSTSSASTEEDHS